MHWMRCPMFASNGRHGSFFHHLRTSRYQGQIILTVSSRFLFFQFRCCGVSNYTDWFEVYNTTRVPDSCCLEFSENCGLHSPGTWWKAVSHSPAAAQQPPSNPGEGQEVVSCKVIRCGVTSGSFSQVLGGLCWATAFHLWWYCQFEYL